MVTPVATASPAEPAPSAPAQTSAPANFAAPDPAPGRVFVLGSLNMDIVATADRHPQVGETVLGQDLNYYPGGKGLNQAVAAVRDGSPEGAHSGSPQAVGDGPSPVAMLGAVGDDPFGQQLRQLVADEGIDQTWLATKPEAPSGVALIVVAQSDNTSDNTIVVAPGANAALTPQDFAALEFSRRDVLLAQFEVPQEVTSALFARARAAGATTILNPAPFSPIPADLLANTDYLVVNDTEREQLGETDTSSLKAIIHTRGSQGVEVATRDHHFALPAHNVKVVDTTAAGDCFCGVLAASLLRRQPLKEAVARANAAAALCVQSPGATPSIPFGQNTAKLLAIALN